AQDRLERSAPRRELVLEPPGARDGLPRLDDAALLQTAEALGEDGRGDALGRVEELREPLLAVEEHVADHEQRPRVSHDVERSRDGARRAQGTWWCGMGGPRHGPTVSRCLHHASDAAIVRGPLLATCK